MGSFYRSLLQNHVLANLTFVLVLVIGVLSYLGLPRQQDPTINFNWIVITTVLPGASALDVEKKVTDPIEDAVRKIQDINFMSSNSRESVSSILVRFQDIDERNFDKRVADLRREIQNKEDELPRGGGRPGHHRDHQRQRLPLGLHRGGGHGRRRKSAHPGTQRGKGPRTSERRRSGGPRRAGRPGTARHLRSAQLETLTLTPGQVVDTVTAFFQDIAAGDARLGEQNWLVRLVGANADPAYLAARTVVGAPGEVTLGEVARVERGRANPPAHRLNGRPAVLLAAMKQANANTLELVDRIKAYMEERNVLAAQTGVELVLVDDQTVPTRESISLMQNNALIGLLLVLRRCVGVSRHANRRAHRHRHSVHSGRHFLGPVQRRRNPQRDRAARRGHRTGHAGGRRRGRGRGHLLPLAPRRGCAHRVPRVVARGGRP